MRRLPTIPEATAQGAAAAEADLRAGARTLDQLIEHATTRPVECAGDVCAWLGLAHSDWIGEIECGTISADDWCAVETAVMRGYRAALHAARRVRDYD